MTMDIKITRLGAFNMDENRRFIDNAEMGRAYLHLPKNLKKVDFDLSVGFPEKFKYHNMTYDGIANILNFLLPRKDLLKELDFVTRRGLLSSIMDACSGGNYDFLVAKVGSVIYLVDKPWPTGSGELNINEYCGRRFENFLFAGETLNLLFLILKLKYFLTLQTPGKVLRMPLDLSKMLPAFTWSLRGNLPATDSFTMPK